MGAPGSFRKDISNFIAEQFSGWHCIDLGDILKKEMIKKTEIGKQIQSAWKSYKFRKFQHFARINFVFRKIVDDNLVTEIIVKEIRRCEDEKKSWIVQGFPRTKVQALALQKHQILPDKIFQLDTARGNSLSRIKHKLIQINQSLYGPELDEIAAQCFQEHQLNQRGVEQVLSKFITRFDSDMYPSQQETQQELLNIFKLHFKVEGIKSPHKIIILGPPASGKTTQCNELATKFGLVKISVHDLLKQEMKDNPANGQVIERCLSAGAAVPDYIINPLVEARLKSSESQFNGWVMEGFPENEAQINLLQALRVKPSITFLFEQPEDESKRRLTQRKIDPETGILYNQELRQVSDEQVANRLVSLKEDDWEVAKNRLVNWNNNVSKLEDHFKMNLNIQNSDHSVEGFTALLSD